MRFSTKRGDASDADSNLTYLRGFKAGNTTVRFLQEMEEWDKYREHYTLDGKMFPCIKTEGTCPGCTSNNEKVSKSSRKYATNVFLVDTGQVLPFKIPITLAKLLENRADRNGGTLLNRDYVVMRSGSGMDTSYDVDTDEKYVIDVAEKLKKMGMPKDAVWQVSLISPAQIEKVTWRNRKDDTMTLSPKKQAIIQQDYVARIAGKPTVALASDSRDALITDASPLFGAVEAPTPVEAPGLPSWLT